MHDIIQESYNQVNRKKKKTVENACRVKINEAQFEVELFNSQKKKWVSKMISPSMGDCCNWCRDQHEKGKKIYLGFYYKGEYWE
jgi:hypothetical protein